jgi:hypothetical protein
MVLFIFIFRSKLSHLFDYFRLLKKKISNFLLFDFSVKEATCEEKIGEKERIRK